MASMSIRGVDDQVLLRLKQQAEQEMISLNSLVLRLLANGGKVPPAKGIQKYHDLDALAGTWTAQDAQEFARSNAPFGEVDPGLWA